MWLVKRANSEKAEVIREGNELSIGQEVIVIDRDPIFVILNEREAVLEIKNSMRKFRVGSCRPSKFLRPKRKSVVDERGVVVLSKKKTLKVRVI